MTTNSKLLDAALEYAHLGWKVLPLHSPRGSGCSCRRRDCDDRRVGRHPRIRHWVQEASDDKSAITEWWTRWPNANVGIRTGGQSGFFAADVDPRNGGSESFQELMRGHSMAPTVEVLTPRDGFHLYLAQMGLSLASTKLAPGIDIKAEGGYVIAPPSLSGNGVQYAFRMGASPTDIGIVDTPDWLLTLLPLSISAPASPPPLTGSTAATVGLWRPLSERIGHLLRDGDLARQYPSRSEVTQAIATEAVRNHWTEDDLFRALRNRSNRGGEKVQEMELHAAQPYVARSWQKAQSFLSSPPEGPPPELAAQLQRIEDHAARINWTGNAGPADWAVMQALIGIAEQACKLEISASVRLVADRANIHRTTAALSLKRLTKRGLIILVTPGEGGKGAVYRLVMHNDADTQVTRSQERGIS